ncbi:double-stranded RNA-binding protein 4 isoform X2 [Cryptomeria japonica]|uniref:double-stranded RNA-binding protein 4 isoform X2 n=1 Tax=Cryptomeria japonica TaxID=3369 RepID=UPI0025AB630D|nr:double-stranded RNA-binding protein 4 isoform X2 [Cryptomeria japonica]XP_057822055.1 double-stranded RNA-binding protein 4 isoform X2 [Cryptomeria japonica]
MASYKNKLQVYTQRMHWPLPVYESVNEGFDHLPNFKCFVTVNGLRYESSGSYSHKKVAEQSAAQAAIQDLATKHPEYKFEDPFGQKQLTELLERMGRGPPIFSVTKTGVAHSPEFTSTVEIDGASYVGGVAKSKKEAETKAALVAIRTINQQVGDLCLQLQLQADSRVSNELQQPSEECKDIKPELKAATNSCTPSNEFLVGTNSKQFENSLEMLITNNEDPVEKGPGKSNASDENSAPSLNPHNQLQQETFLIQPEQEEIKLKKEGVQEVNLKDSINKRSRSESENREQMNGKKRKEENEKNHGMISSNISMGN